MTAKVAETQYSLFVREGLEVDMKIGVSGASGHLGRAVVSELLQRACGHEVVGIIRRPDRSRCAYEADLRRARMKAVRVLEYGGQLVFDNVPTPTIARDEILVKIKSTAVNHLDLVKASGTARQILPINLPWIPGHEFSGVVEQIGSDVAAYAPGDAVFGTTSGMGAYAEYLAVKAAAIARKPSNLSFEEAASVPVAAQTAWQGLFTQGHLEKGQTILIHGGAGGVGAYAVQLASHAGATVIVTASGGDDAFLKSIGANRVIDYRTAKFENELSSKVDVVFDLVGGDTQTRSFAALKKGGFLIAANQPVSPAEIA